MPDPFSGNYELIRAFRKSAHHQDQGGEHVRFTFRAASHSWFASFLPFDVHTWPSRYEILGRCNAWFVWLTTRFHLRRRYVKPRSCRIVLWKSPIDASKRRAAPQRIDGRWSAEILQCYGWPYPLFQLSSGHVPAIKAEIGFRLEIEGEIEGACEDGWNSFSFAEGRRTKFSKDNDRRFC